jgi:hypothetical protein
MNGPSLLAMAKDVARMFNAEWRGVRTAEQKWVVEERKVGVKGEDDATRITTRHDPDTVLPVDFPFRGLMCDWFQRAAAA